MSHHAEKRGADSHAEHTYSFFQARFGEPLTRVQFEDLLRHALRDNEPPAFMTFFGAIRAGEPMRPGDIPTLPPYPLLTVLFDDPGRDQRARTNVILDPSGKSSFQHYPEREGIVRLAYEHGFGYGEGAGGMIPLAAVLTTGATSTIIQVDDLLARPEGDPAGDAARAYEARAKELGALGRPLGNDDELARLTRELTRFAETKDVIISLGATPSYERLVLGDDTASGFTGFAQAVLDPLLESGSALVEEGGMFFEVVSGEGGATTYVWGDVTPDLERSASEAKPLSSDGEPAAPKKLADAMSDGFVHVVLSMFFRGYQAGLKARRRVHATSLESRKSFVYMAHQKETYALLEDHLGEGASPRMISGHLSMSPATAEVLRQHDINPQVLLVFHQHGDWGDATEAEREENERVLAPLSVPEGGEPEPNPPGVVVSRFKPGHPALPEGYAGPELAVATVITEMDQWSCAVSVADRAALVEGIRAGQYLNPFASVDPEIDPHQAEGFPPIMPVGMLTAVFTPDAEAEAMKVLRDCQEHYTVPEEVLQEKAAEG